MKELALPLLERCARCGQEHRDIPFQPFTRPPHDEDPPITHWALCPTNGEPILLGFVS